MNKLKMNSRRQVFQKFGKNLVIKYLDSKGKECKKSFKLQETLSRISKFSTDPADPFTSFYFNLRTKDNLGASCRICDSSVNVEMHHVRALRTGVTKNDFTCIMRQMNRKQIPVCRACHKNIHSGRYDGINLKKLADLVKERK